MKIRSEVNIVKTNKDISVFSIIKKEALSHCFLTVGVILCVTVSVIASLIPPLLLARIIDRLTDGYSLSFAAVLLYFGSVLLENGTSSAQEALLVLFGQKMTHALRSEMAGKLKRLPAKTLSEQEPGTLAARFSGDVNTVETLFTSGIISMAADACRIISIMAVIAMKNPGLALILLFILPPFAAFTRLVQKRMLASQLENRRAVAAVSAQVPEALHNIRTIHLLGMEAYMEQRYDRRITESYRAMEKTNFYDAVYSPVVLLLNAAVVGIVMLLSASKRPKLLTLFGMSVGTSVAVINYISRIFAPIESLGMEIQAVQSAMAGVSRINAFLALKERRIPDTDIKKNVPWHILAPRAVACDILHLRASAHLRHVSAFLCNGEFLGISCYIKKDHAQGDVIFSHVTFGYDEHPVLVDFSMTVKKGEHVTLIGRTGAGKSTIFRLLLGLYPPQAGSVTIGGIHAFDIPDEKRRSCICCVEQRFSRVPGTVLDQITLSDPSITMEMAQKAARLSGIDEAIRLLPDGYLTPCTEGLFSQGEWQLLSIARAAASDPAVLLLDEITANLDSETEARVLTALQRASRGRTVISISHRIYEDLGGRTVEIISPR